MLEVVNPCLVILHSLLDFLVFRGLGAEEGSRLKFLLHELKVLSESNHCGTLKEKSNWLEEERLNS